jgi:hypothetical protein
MDEREESMMAEDMPFDLPELKRIYAEILSSKINEDTVTKMFGLAIYRGL